MVDAKKEPFLVRLLSVIRDAGYVQKKGTNKEQGYRYAMETDFLELVKPLLVNAGIVPIPTYELVSNEIVTTQAGKPAVLTTLKLSLILRDAFSAEQIVIETIGQGRDPQDKAPYKAMTGAMKYAISKAFMIPTGDDPEEEEEKEEPAHKKGGEKPAPTVSPAQAFMDAVTKIRYQLTPEDFNDVMAEFECITWPDDALMLSINDQRAFYKALAGKVKK